MTDVTQEEPLTWPNGELVTVDSIEAYAEEGRGIAHPLDDSEIRTPDWVISSLDEVSRWASRMVIVIENAELLKRWASEDLADARAQAVIDAAGFPAREHASRVRLATVELRRDYIRKAVAYEKARRVGNLLKEHSIRLGTVGKLLELMYGKGSGRG